MLFRLPSTSGLLAELVALETRFTACTGFVTKFIINFFLKLHGTENLILTTNDLFNLKVKNICLTQTAADSQVGTSGALCQTDESTFVGGGGVNYLVKVYGT